MPKQNPTERSIDRVRERGLRLAAEDDIQLVLAPLLIFRIAPRKELPHPPMSIVRQTGHLYRKEDGVYVRIFGSKEVMFQVNV